MKEIQDTFGFSIDTSFLDVFSTDYKYEELTPEQRDIHDALFPRPEAPKQAIEQTIEAKANQASPKADQASQRVNKASPRELKIEGVTNMAELLESAKLTILNDMHLSSAKNTYFFPQNLKPGITENDLRKAFEKYGEITHICIKTDKTDSKTFTGNINSMDLGFVNFNEATNSLSKMQKDADIKALTESNPQPNAS